MIKTTLTAPWIEYYKKIDAMFAHDTDVTVVYDADQYRISVFVEDQAKADALSLLLRPENTFGAITVLVDVVPANTFIKTNKDLYATAFRGNGAVYDLETYDGAFKATYVIFVKEVVQYFNDDLSSATRLRSTLYEDIAKEIFNETPGVYFCTASNNTPTVNINYNKLTKAYV